MLPRCTSLPTPVAPLRRSERQASNHAIHESSRRQFLSYIAAVPFVSSAGMSFNALARSNTSPSGDWSSPGLAAPEDEFAPKFFNTASGVKVQQLSEGTGAKVHRGDTALLDYVLRRANGYFIYSTVEGVSFQPKDIPIGPVVITLDDSATVPGLVDGCVGIRVGGKARILVPPALSYAQGDQRSPQMPTFATARQLANHRGEPLLFEVQILRVVT